MPTRIRSPGFIGIFCSGSVFLSASNLNKASITLDVEPTSATGNAGTASYVSTSTSAFFPVSGQLAINISGGTNGGNAGTAIISAGGNLTYDPNIGIVTAASKGSGPNLVLTAGNTATGTLFVDASLASAPSSGGGAAGSITLNSNSATAFVVNSSTSKNGINGTASVASAGGNGSITIANRGGGITDNVGVTNASNVTYSTKGATAGTITIANPITVSGTLTLSAGGSGAILAGNNTLTATNTVNLTSGTGSLGGGNPIIVSTANLSANTSGTGTVNIINKNANVALNLEASSAGSSFAVSSNGANIDTSGAITAATSVNIASTASSGASSIILDGNVSATNAAAGAVSLSTAGNGTITDLVPSGADSLQAKTVNLNTAGGAIGSGGTASTALRVRATSLGLGSGATGLANIDNLGQGSSALTLTSASTAQAFTLQSASAVTIAPSITLADASSISINTSSGKGGITLGAALGNAGTTNLVLLTAAAGNITGTGATSTTLAASTVDLTSISGSFGSAAVPLKLNTGTFNSSTVSGLINVNDANGGNVNSLSTTGALTFLSAASTVFNGNVAGSTVTIKPSGTTTFNGNISSATGSLILTQSGAFTTTVAGNITSQTTVALTTAGGAAFNNITALKGSVTVSTAGSTSFGSVIGTGSAGSVSLSQSATAGGISLTGPSSAGSTFIASTAGNGGITTNGQISAPASVTLKNTGAGTNGSISLDGSVLATNTASGSVTLIASGSGTISDAVNGGNDFIEGKTLTINSATPVVSGNIGSPATPLRVETASLAANSTGLVNINNLGFNPGTGAAPLILTSASSQGSFTLQSASAVTITPTLASATAININTSAGSGGITINGTTLGSTASTSAVLLTTAAGNISGAATISTKNGVVDLTSSSGNFGTATTALKINATSVSPSTATGIINVSDTNSGAVSVSQMTTTATTTFASSSATSTTFNGPISGSSVTLKTTGDTTFSGNVVAAGGALLLNETGTLSPTSFMLASVGAARVSAGTTITLNTVGSTSFADNAIISANSIPVNPSNNGVIAITETTGMLSTGTSDSFSINGKTAGGITLLEKENGNGSGITIGSSTTFDTTVTTKTGNSFPLPGQISVAIGSVLSSPTNTTPPSHEVTVNTSQAKGSKNTAYFGANAGNITTSAPVTMTIIGNSAIVFNAGASSTISLGGNTSFTADPPFISPVLTAPPAQHNSSGTVGALFLPAVTTQTQAAPAMGRQTAAVGFRQTGSAAGLQTASVLALPTPAPEVLQTTTVTAPSITNASPDPDQAHINQGNAITTAAQTSKLLYGGLSEFGTEIERPTNQLLDAIIVSDKNFGLENSRSPQLAELPGSTAKKRTMALRDGNVLLAPSVDTTVKTPFGSVEIDAGSMVLVLASQRGLAVFNLNDEHSNAVRIHTGNRKITLNVSRQAVITSTDVQSFEQVNPVEAIGYRYMADFELGQGLKAFNSDFSITTAVEAIKPLKQILASRHPEAVRLSNRLMKTAAALMQMKAGSESYQRILHPRLTAYADR